MAVLDDWYDEIQRDGKIGWLAVYHRAVHQPISDMERFFDAVAKFGDFPVFEALVVASFKKLDGDPIHYVLAVASNIWSEERQAKSNNDVYARGIERTKQHSYEQSMELAEKLKKVQDGR